MKKIIFRAGSKFFVPYPLRAALISVRAVRYIVKGIRSLAGGRLDVEVLDAAAIGVSILRSDFKTAGSVMFLLGIGEILEEWTHKKSVGDLARSMSLNVSKVWKREGDQEILTSVSDISADRKSVV